MLPRLHSLLALELHYKASSAYKHLEKGVSALNMYTQGVCLETNEQAYLRGPYWSPVNTHRT